MYAIEKLEGFAKATGHTMECANYVYAACDENLSWDFPAPFQQTPDQRGQFDSELARRVLVALEDNELCSCKD